MASTFPTSLDTFTNPTATSLLTSPSHAQQHADINDAVEALEAKVAIGNTVLGTYTAYTPILTGITIGNGTSVGSYCRVNNFVHYIAKITFGSTTVFTTGNAAISVPLNIHSDMSAVGFPLGTAYFYDVSAGGFYSGAPMSSGSATTIYGGPVISSTPYTQWGGWSSTAPMTWATGDIASFNLFYKAA